MKRALVLLVAVGAIAVQARAATYYVVVAGLGGEPDYEQRFMGAANVLPIAAVAEPTKPPPLGPSALAAAHRRHP